MRICLFFLITAFLMGCSSTGNQRQEPENQTLETILNRKSVRKYKDRPVEKEKIDKLIRAGMAAPSSRDRRPWEFIIVTDRKALDTMAEGLPFARMLKETRQAIVVCGDTIKSSNAWFLDCSAASQNLLLAAESMGLETFGLAPSKPVGVLKEAIKNAILDGVIPNEYEAARQFLIQRAEKMGLKPIL